MTSSPRGDVVSEQYERWRYPAPVMDLEAWNRQGWEWFDPWHAHRVLWPDRAYKPDMDILIAGCGTNQAAVYAYNNRHANVFAVDISEASIAHQLYLKSKYQLDNLEVQLLPIEELPTLNRTFDLIISTGVLHHLADPGAGMNALAKCLKQDGVMGIMLYAKYGRIGVELMQSIYRDIDLHQDDPSLRIVKNSLNFVAETHPAHGYLNIAKDIHNDPGLVDTFLHGRERSYTVDDCLELVDSAGLVFQDWFLKAGYYPPRIINPDSEFLDAIEAQPQEKVWSIMERINTMNGCHFFMACHPDRPVDTYRIDFASSAATDYVPSLRWKCALNGTVMSRFGWSFELDPTPLAIAQQIDGQNTIGQIVQRVIQSGVLSHDEAANIDTTVRALLRSLWQFDFIAITV